MGWLRSRPHRRRGARPIFIGTTFRDFDRSANDAIQRRFLRSLQAQRHENLTLVVTLFGELTVERVLQESGVRYVLYEGKWDDYRFSLTDVLVNAIEAAPIREPSIVGWTTPDVVLQPTFFDDLDAKLPLLGAATSHPHISKPTLHAQGDETGDKTSLWDGFDLMFFDTALLRKPEVHQSIVKYRNVDWGGFELFLVALASRFARRRVNLWGLNTVVKIENDRVAAGETTEFHRRSWERNAVLLKQFLEAHGLTLRFLELPYCHRQFKVIDKIAYMRVYGGVRLKLALDDRTMFARAAGTLLRVAHAVKSPSETRGRRAQSRRGAR